jgi:hypothetical protein
VPVQLAQVAVVFNLFCWLVLGVLSWWIGGYLDPTSGFQPTNEASRLIIAFWIISLSQAFSAVGMVVYSIGRGSACPWWLWPVLVAGSILIAAICMANGTNAARRRELK